MESTEPSELKFASLARPCGVTTCWSPGPGRRNAPDRRPGRPGDLQISSVQNRTFHSKMDRNAAEQFDKGQFKRERHRENRVVDSRMDRNPAEQGPVQKGTTPRLGGLQPQARSHIAKANLQDVTPIGRSSKESCRCDATRASNRSGCVSRSGIMVGFLWVIPSKENLPFPPNMAPHGHLKN